MGPYIARELASAGGRALVGPAAIEALFCSPFRRAIQTAEPIARALKLLIRVEWGFSEHLVKASESDANPLEVLRKRGMEWCRPMHRWLDERYTSALVPEFPEVVGRARAGDGEQRKKALERHRAAVLAALASARGGSLLIVAHGSTHDFVTEALCGLQHPREHHTPACVPHCSITELAEEASGWRIVRYGSSPRAILDEEARPRPAPAGLPGSTPLPLPHGSALYEGVLSHPRLAAGVPRRLLLAAQEEVLPGHFKSQWALMEALQPVAVAVDGASVLISRDGMRERLQLRGSVDGATGHIAGRCSLDGEDGGSFELLPGPARVQLRDTDGDALLFTRSLTGGVSEYCDGVMVAARINELCIDPQSGSCDDGDGFFSVPLADREHVFEQLRCLFAAAGGRVVTRSARRK